MSKILIYQVLPRLYGNTNATCKPNGTIQENGVGKFSDFSVQLLKEIKDMGYTHIWFTGVLRHATQTDYSTYDIPTSHPEVVKGVAGSPYAIADYYDVCPDFADSADKRMDEFEALVKRVHDQQLKLLIDFVPNHVAREYKSINCPKGIDNLGEKDDKSLTFNPNNNFYYLPGEKLSIGSYEEFPAKVTGNDCLHAYPCVKDWYETIKLNYGVDCFHNYAKHFDPVPDTWKKMLAILLFWKSKGVDGFRCDMAEMVPVEFWNWVIPQVKQKNKPILFIAEIYNINSYRNYIENGQFDYLYDKVGLYDTLRNVICGYEPASAITRCWQQIDGLQERMLNFLENHDEQRIASDFFAGNPFAAVPAMIVAATMNTSPVMIYQGQELGENGMDAEGFSGRDGRTTIFDYWSMCSVRNWINSGKYNTEYLSPEQIALRNFYVNLIQLCGKEEAISKGSFYDLMYANYDTPEFNSNKQYTFLRKHKDTILLVIVNFEKDDVETSVKIPHHAFEFFGMIQKKNVICTDLLTKERIKRNITPDDYFCAKLPAFSGRIYKWKIDFSEKK